MNTTFIGIKELRQHMAKTTARAHKKGERVIVLRKNKPLFELRPLSSTDALVETLRIGIEEARADVRAGRTKTQRQVEKLFGL